MAQTQKIIANPNVQQNMREDMSGFRLATADTETDPFAKERKVKPFTAGFFNGKRFKYFWGKDCIKQFVDHLRGLKEPHLIYIHNGGKFDLQFMIQHIENPFIINGRIVKCNIGIHQIRDSYAAVPVPLKGYEKKEIDYTKLEKNVREQNKDEIIAYMKSDCIYLYEMMFAFQQEFGDALTIGQAAMRELKKVTKFETLGENMDTFLRQYYYGGRNQCFKAGIIKGDFKIFDVNSMYPFVMKNFKHPVSRSYNVNNKITSKTNFALIIAKNYGALPQRTPAGLDFTKEFGEFYATIHEIEAGLETGTLEINRVKHAIEFNECISFDQFIDHFYGSRLQAKANGDKLRDIFYKLVQNSCYGKFAQNPMNFFDYMITKDVIPPEGWQLDEVFEETTLWKRPSNGPKFFNNVATAASITGAARAVLLRGLAAATNPVYCDTDSIICEALNAPQSSTELGAWKLEASADTLAIAGKKLYAAFANDEVVKRASKGGNVSGKQMIDICRGGTIELTNLAPTFNFGKQTFIKRRFTRTANAKAFARSPRKTR